MYHCQSATEAIHLFVQPGTAGFSHSKFDLIMPYQHASFCGDVCNMLGVVVGRHRTASKKDSSRTWEKRCEDVVKLHLCISSSHFRSVWCWGMRRNVSKPACRSWGHALGDCHRWSWPNISDTVHQEAYIAVSLVEACCGHTRTHVYSTVTGWFVRPVVTSQSTPKSSVISRYQDGVPSKNKMQLHYMTRHATTIWKFWVYRCLKNGHVFIEHARHSMVWTDTPPLQFLLTNKDRQGSLAGGESRRYSQSKPRKQIFM